jgi:hypothetical protein
MERIWTQDIFRASDGINPVQMQEKISQPPVESVPDRRPATQRAHRVLSLLERRIFHQGGARWIMTNSELVKAMSLPMSGLKPWPAARRVITTRSNGAVEIIVNHKEGYVLTSWNEQEVAARIRDALQGGNERMTGERAARKAAKFGMDGYMEPLSLYYQVCEAKRT